ncbi:MAG TPA: enoyl-CoA hydratase-related protein [Mycobacteriales bacterium]
MGDVRVTQAGALLTIALAAPNGINGLTTEVRADLLAALTGPAAADEVRAVVLRGEGRTFCVGQDLREHAARLDADPSRAFDVVASEYAPIATAIRALAKPVVAGVNGAAAGAGISLALACDVRVASDAARFTFAFAGIGLVADTGLHATLAAAVGAARARALLLLDAPLSAEQARGAGLVDVLVPAGDFDAEIEALAGRLAAGPTRAYAETKAITQLAEPTGFQDVLDAEAAAQQRLGMTADHAGAVRAFLAKEKPDFRGA